MAPPGHAPGSMFPAGFEHIAGGYAAGYYSHLWSQAFLKRGPASCAPPPAA